MVFEGGLEGPLNGALAPAALKETRNRDRLSSPENCRGRPPRGTSGSSQGPYSDLTYWRLR